MWKAIGRAHLIQLKTLKLKKGILLAVKYPIGCTINLIESNKLVTLNWTSNSKGDHLSIFNWINWVPYFIFNNVHFRWHPTHSTTYNEICCSLKWITEQLWGCQSHGKIKQQYFGLNKLKQIVI